MAGETTAQMVGVIEQVERSSDQPRLTEADALRFNIPAGQFDTLGLIRLSIAPGVPDQDIPAVVLAFGECTGAPASLR